MATLSRDNGSDWHADGVRRRDFRHSKDGPEALPARRKKDTSRWCKGRVGRAHTRMTVKVDALGMWAGYSFDEERCARCGKRWWMRRGVLQPTVFTSVRPMDLTGSVWEIVQTSGAPPTYRDLGARVERVRRENC